MTFILLMLLAGQAEASVFFKIVDTPTIYVTPGGETSFNVSVRNLGSESTYAGLKFTNIPEGLSIVGPRCTKWVDSGTILEFDCQLKVEAGDIPPGNYTFEVGIVAEGAPPEWTPVQVVVSEDAALPDQSEDGEADLAEPEEEYPPCPIARDEGGSAEEPAPQEGEEGIPGFGIWLALGALALALISGLARRG
ncbi:MAG TPA: hypothetical protein PLZ42_06170 [Methanothrix sp.]|nr:hypothetical protein [Methanothrix sp.]